MATNEFGILEKLPKSWKHWCKDQRFGPHKRKGSKSPKDWWYLQGHGHYWRVNCFLQMECGDNYEDFDRWARCEIYSEPMPKTRQEFRDFVSRALAAKRAS